VVCGFITIEAAKLKSGGHAMPQHPMPEHPMSKHPMSKHLQGPIEIDPQTRDIIMNEYLCEVYKGVDGKLHQKVLAAYDHVKDECKALGAGECGKKK